MRTDLGFGEWPMKCEVKAIITGSTWLWNIFFSKELPQFSFRITICLSPSSPLLAPVNFLPLTTYQSISDHWWYQGVIWYDDILYLHNCYHLTWVKKSWAAHFFFLKNFLHNQPMKIQRRRRIVRIMTNECSMMITTAVSKPVHWLIEWIFCLQLSTFVIEMQQKVYDWVYGHSLS